MEWIHAKSTMQFDYVRNEHKIKKYIYIKWLENLTGIWIHIIINSLTLLYYVLDFILFYFTFLEILFGSSQEEKKGTYIWIQLLIINWNILFPQARNPLHSFVNSSLEVHFNVNYN